MSAFMFLAAALLVSTYSARDGPLPFAGGFRWRKKAAGDLLAVAFDLDLFAQCLRAGLSPAAAATAVGANSALPAWHQVGVLLGVGVSPARAWQPAAATAELSELAALVIRSEQSGASIADGVNRLARQAREKSADAAISRAERAGVWISLPLTLCFLPAFIILGLVPIVVSLGFDLFH